VSTWYPYVQYIFFLAEIETCYYFVDLSLFLALVCWNDNKKYLSPAPEFAENILEEASSQGLAQTRVCREAKEFGIERRVLAMSKSVRVEAVFKIVIKSKNIYCSS
jgi:hypothetical protein